MRAESQSASSCFHAQGRRMDGACRLRSRNAILDIKPQNTLQSGGMKLATKGNKGAIIFCFCAFCASLSAVDSGFRFGVLSVKAPSKPVAKCDRLRPQFELDTQIAEA